MTLPRQIDRTKLPRIQLAALEAATAEQAIRSRPWPCPVCGDLGVHLVGTGTLQDDTLTFIAGDGVHRIRGVRLPGRGSRIITLAECESGHLLSLGLRFATGQVYASLAELSDSHGWLPELWRAEA